MSMPNEGSSGTGSLPGRAVRRAPGRVKSAVVPLPDEESRRQRRANSLEATNRILDENAPKIMEAMVALALSAEDERARGMVGMKLLERHQPAQRGPLVAISQDNRQVTVTSHLGLPSDPVFRNQLGPAEETPGAALSESSTRVIDASSMVARPLPRYRPAPPHMAPPASGSQPRYLTKESPDDGNPFEAPNARSREPESGTPQRKVRW